MNKHFLNGFRLFFVIYTAALVFVVFFTPNRFEGYNRLPPVYLIPFRSIIGGLYKTPGEHFWPYYSWYFINLIGNILLFVPMGFLLKALNQKRNTMQIILIGSIVSMSIELLQFLFKIGVCDIDDVLLNTLGTLCGLLLCKALKLKFSD